MKITWISAACVFFLSVLLLSCGQSEYERMLKRELSSGERRDSLFLGISLGMTSKAFFQHCWELNKRQLIKQGPQNQSVEYIPPDIKPEVVMNFYPRFHEDKIYEMNVSFHYGGWGSWNRKLWADSLQIRIVDMLETWYGPGFIQMEHPQKGLLHVRVDGNRQILVFKQDEQYVRVLFTDMLKQAEVESVARRAGSGKGDDRNGNTGFFLQ